MIAGVCHNSGSRADHQTAHTCEAARAEYDEVGLVTSEIGQQLFGWIASEDLMMHHGADALQHAGRAVDGTMHVGTAVFDRNDCDGQLMRPGQNTQGVCRGLGMR